LLVLHDSASRQLASCRSLANHGKASLAVSKAGASSLRLSRRAWMDLHDIVHWQPIDCSRAGCLLPPLKLPRRRSIVASDRFCWVAGGWSKKALPFRFFVLGKALQNFENRTLSIQNFFPPRTSYCNVVLSRNIQRFRNKRRFLAW
jgi:hypothetical protein